MPPVLDVLAFADGEPSGVLRVTGPGVDEGVMVRELAGSMSRLPKKGDCNAMAVLSCVGA